VNSQSITDLFLPLKTLRTNRTCAGKVIIFTKSDITVSLFLKRPFCAKIKFQPWGHEYFFLRHLSRNVVVIESLFVVYFMLWIIKTIVLNIDWQSKVKSRQNKLDIFSIDTSHLNIREYNPLITSYSFYICSHFEKRFRVKKITLNFWQIKVILYILKLRLRKEVLASMML